MFYCILFGCFIVVFLRENLFLIKINNRCWRVSLIYLGGITLYKNNYYYNLNHKYLLDFAVNITPSEIFSIQLNNFLHRIDCKITMMELVAQQGCSLKRIRRSKNWSLTGTQSQLLTVSEQLQQGRTVWISDAIHKALPKSSFDLAAIVHSHPDMTLNRLIAETGCTLIEARVALDKAENLI